MSLENQVARVSKGTKDTLKTLINKLGGNVTDELIDQYPSIASALDDVDPAGSAQQALNDAKSYTDQKISEIDALFKPAGKSYLTFSSPNSFTLAVNGSTKHWDGTLEYFASNKTWTVWDGTTTLSAVDNDGEYVLYLRGTGNRKITGSISGCNWILSGSDITCIGNIENLLDYATVGSGAHPTMGNYCYAKMFMNCSSITQAPALPATTLAEGCYENMFYGCTSLAQAPVLPATALAYSCYAGMFYDCTALTKAPELPATTLAKYCYQRMFYDCTALTQAPALPATTLANYCYGYMFQGCTGLKLSSTQTGEYMVAYRIPTTGTGTTATDALIDMFGYTGGTFTGTPEINTTYYLSSDNMVVRETEMATWKGYVGSMIDAVTPESIGAAAATHASQHASDGSDPITPDSIGAYSKTELDTLLAGKAPAGYGLGGGATKTVETDFNNYMDNGVYEIPASMESIQNAPPIGLYGMLEVSRASNAIVQDVWGPQWGYSYVSWVHVRRVCTSYDGNPDNWSEWEWPEPPFAVGTVYRTTEKHLDSPVYKKMDSNGVIWWSTDQSTWKREAERVGAAPAYSYGTDDLTAGTSELETGKLYFVYE